MRQRCYTQSTVLIPDKLLDYFQSRCSSQGSRRAYLNFLIENYLPRIAEFASELHRRRVPKWKTHYQLQGQVLHRKSFVPFPDDWEALRHAATSLGVSMCFLFVFIMELEQRGEFAENHLKNQDSDWNSGLVRQIYYPIIDRSSKLSRFLVKNLRFLVRYIN